MSQKISAVIIMKNEEVMLPRLLDSLKGIDELILCDTGSSDNTVEVAERYVGKGNVKFIQWEDSFCKARNYAKSFATGDWILSIDCDEILHDLAPVREAVELAEAKGALAVNVKMISEDRVKQVFYFPRLFKNCPQVWWEGAIHNHVSVAGQDFSNPTITYGYSPAHALDKDRAYRILKKEVERTGNGREMFYLAREHFYRKEFEECIQTLGRYVQISRYLAEKAEAFLMMARAYWELKMPDDARDALVQALIINSNFKEAAAFMATIAGEGSGNQKWEANARQWRSMANSADNNDVLFIRHV